LPVHCSVSPWTAGSRITHRSVLPAALECAALECRGSWKQNALHWPWATLFVNVTGCFIIGATHAMTLKLGLAPEWQAALATGLAGGLTTFSSWTTATVRLLS
jgi:hypothetical protein